MPRAKSEGKCLLCGRTFGKTAMARHLTTCLAKHDAPAGPQKSAKIAKLFHIQVQGFYDKRYWLQVEMPETATFNDLDDFLRNIWLECCGHLSAFRIKRPKPSLRSLLAGGKLPSLERLGALLHADDEVPFETQLGTRLSQGLEFEHEYDFGSTTKLSLKVMGVREGSVGSEGPVRLLARNDPPLIPCAKCGQPATVIDREDSYGEEGWYCDACAEANEIGEEMTLPVVNSPRTGVCGYTG